MINMISIPSYCIYFPGGGSGNFIASVLIYFLSDRQQMPLFHSTGHSHDSYLYYLEKYTNCHSLNFADDQWSESLTTSVPWLVICPPMRLKTQFFSAGLTNIRIHVRPEDLVDISFNHFYKNYRIGIMGYTTSSILENYHKYLEQGRMPQIRDWRQLSIDDTMQLIRDDAPRLANCLPEEHPDDHVIAFQDICQRPHETLEQLALLTGQRVTDPDLKIYQQYVDLNQQLRDKFWRP